MKESIVMPRFKSVYNTLNEDHHKEASDETQMAKIQLKSIMADAAELLQKMDQAEQLDAWVQSKLAVAEDYISAIRKYMEFEEETPAEELPLIPTGDEDVEMGMDTGMEPAMPAIDAVEPPELPGEEAIVGPSDDDLSMEDIESFMSEDPEKDPEPAGDEIEMSMEDDEPIELDLESFSK